MAAEYLQRESGEFRLSEIIRQVQKIDPRRDWTSIQPVRRGTN